MPVVYLTDIEWEQIQNQRKHEEDRKRQYSSTRTYTIQGPIKYTVRY